MWECILNKMWECILNLYSHTPIFSEVSESNRKPTWISFSHRNPSSEHAFVLNQVLNMHFIYLAGETWMLHLTLYLESDAFVQAALFNVYSSQCLTQIWMLEWGAWATVMYCLLSDVCCGFLFLADINPCIWLDPVSITQSPLYPWVQPPTCSNKISKYSGD